MSRNPAHIRAAMRQQEARMVRSGLDPRGHIPRQPDARSVAVATLAMNVSCYYLRKAEMPDENDYDAAKLVAETAYSEGWGWERIVADPDGAVKLVAELWARLDGRQA